MKRIFVPLFHCFCVAIVALTSCRQQTKPANETAAAPVSSSDTTARIYATPEPADSQQTRVSEEEQHLLKAGLVDVQQVDSTIRVELKYSTTDNFVGVDVYGDLSRAYLQKEPAAKLARAQQYLREQHPHYHLLVYDGARSARVQQILWDTLKKPEKLKPLYVADPKEGSIHNYGAAVDLTIADQRGQPLDMGTTYDFFGEMAYPSKEDSLFKAGKLTGQQIANRHLLRNIMRRAGFTPIESEWWHFNAMSLAHCKQEYGIIE